MGADMRNWWTDLSQPTYRSNSGFGQPWLKALEDLDPTLKQLRADSGIEEAQYSQNNNYENVEILEKKYCEKLSGMSRSAIQNAQISNVHEPEQNYQTENTLSSNYPTVFETTCRKCHVDNAVGPAIPFDNKLAFEEWLKTDTHAKSLKWRTLEAPETKRMPPTRSLTDQERGQIERYLRSFN